MLAQAKPRIEISAGVTSVGFVVRTQDWAKDYEEDQFIDISEMVSGTVIVKVEALNSSPSKRRP